MKNNKYYACHETCTGFEGQVRAEVVHVKLLLSQLYIVFDSNKRKVEIVAKTKLLA